MKLIFVFLIIFSVFANQMVIYYYPNSNECEGEMKTEEIKAWGCRKSFFGQKEKLSLTSDCGREQLDFDGILGFYHGNLGCKWQSGNYSAAILDFGKCVDISPYLREEGKGSIALSDCIIEPEKN